MNAAMLGGAFQGEAGHGIAQHSTETIISQRRRNRKKAKTGQARPKRKGNYFAKRNRNGSKTGPAGPKRRGNYFGLLLAATHCIALLGRAQHSKAQKPLFSSGEARHRVAQPGGAFQGEAEPGQAQHSTEPFFRCSALQGLAKHCKPQHSFMGNSTRRTAGHGIA